MRNRYPDFCIKCGKLVKAGEGFFEKQSYPSLVKWKCRCQDCTKHGQHRIAIRAEIKALQEEAQKK